METPKKRSTTMNRGADDERAAIKRKILSEKGNWMAGSDFDEALDGLIRYIDGRAARAAKKPGGLGRKKATK